MADLNNNNLKSLNEPYNKEIEISIIGVLLSEMDKVPLALSYISYEDFYNTSLGILYRAITDLFDDGIDKIDEVLIEEKIRNYGYSYNNILSEDIKEALWNSNHLALNLETYLKQQKDYARGRFLMRKYKEMHDKINENSNDISNAVIDILSDNEKYLEQVRSGDLSNNFKPISEIVKEALIEIGEVARNRGALRGIPTGFTDLDRILNGLHKSDMILIAARPSMGKTAFVLNIASHIALYEKKKAVIFSLEMSKDQLIKRFLSMDSLVGSEKFRDGSLSINDWNDLARTASRLSETKLIIDDCVGLSISELRAKCKQYSSMSEPIDLIIIDYLQLMQKDRKSGRSSENRQQEISDISRGIKLIAREFNVPVIALSQLSRSVESRSDHRPMLSDLRESGAIEQDADVVMFIHRESKYNKDVEDPNKAEIIISKQRNGPVGSVDLCWLPQYTKFTNMEYNN